MENRAQQGNFGIGHMSGGEIKGNAKVAGVINEAEAQNLAEAAVGIQALIQQLEQSYPTNTTTVKFYNLDAQFLNFEGWFQEHLLSATRYHQR